MSIREESLCSVIEKIEKKKIVIPNFQREYEWTTEQVSRLATSFLFDLSIGTLLFYRSELGSKLPYLHFSNYTVCEEKSERKVDYVIDGQQRLTSSLIAFTNFYEVNSIPNSRKHGMKFYLKLIKDCDIFGLKKLEFRRPSIKEDKEYFDNFSIKYLGAVNKTKDIPTPKEDSYGYIELNFFKKERYVIRNELRVIASKRAASADFKLEQRKEIEVIEKWADDFTDYLIEVKKRNLQIVTLEKTIQEVIMTYQVMNTSGKKLSDFDIVAAQYSTVDPKNRLYDVVSSHLSRKLETKFIESIDKYELIRKTENSFSAQGFGRLRWNFNDYMNNGNERDTPTQALNQIMKLLKFKELSDNEKFKIEHYKSDELIQLTPSLVKKNIGSVVESISKGSMFLQLRCGVKDFNRINNMWMIFVISAIFMEKKHLNEKELKRVEFWFYVSRFTSRYRIDQNQRALFDLEMLLSSSNSKEFQDFVRIFREFEDETLREKYLEKDSVLQINENRVSPPMIGQAVCEFGVRKGYEVKTNGAENIFISTLTYPYTKSKHWILEEDHIIPLSFSKIYVDDESTKKFRKEKGHKYNSPANMAYLSKKENIGKNGKTFDIYVNGLTDDYKTRSFIHNYNIVDYDTFIKDRYLNFMSGFNAYLKNLI